MDRQEMYMALKKALALIDKDTQEQAPQPDRENIARDLRQVIYWFEMEVL